VDAREKTFINLFANSWGIRVDWPEVVKGGSLPPSQKFAQLRRHIDAYLAASPPKAQALQLADLLSRLIHADQRVTEAEALIAAEIGAHLEQYGEERDRVVYEVHLVPQSQAQAEAIAAAFPRMQRRVLPSGAVGVAATCYSPEYAEIVRDQFSGLDWYTAVSKVTAAERVARGVATGRGDGVRPSLASASSLVP
jgi:hypothetical protein